MLVSEEPLVRRLVVLAGLGFALERPRSRALGLLLLHLDYVRNLRCVVGGSPAARVQRPSVVVDAIAGANCRRLLHCQGEFVARVWRICHLRRRFGRNAVAITGRCRHVERHIWHPLAQVGPTTGLLLGAVQGATFNEGRVVVDDLRGERHILRAH